jgi:hypothetical protein
MYAYPPATAVIAGSLTGGIHGSPFSAALVDLESLGYRQQEFVVEGTANSFRPVGPLGFDGRWNVENASTAPFRTRILVTAPVDPSKFNGTVLAEWNNVSAGFEIMVADAPELFERGYSHVGISAQYVGVHGHRDGPMGLTAWDPQRYETLTHPGDRYSYDIFTQSARLLRPDRPTQAADPLYGLTVEKLVALGHSQSAGRLASYVNAIVPREPLFDAVMLATYFGAGADIDSDALFDARAIDPSVPRQFPVGTRLRDDLEIPIMVVNSETEVLPSLPVRQPDRDRFRWWEIAGTAHVNTPHMAVIMAKVRRDGLSMPVPAEVGDIPPMCAVSWKPVFIAAIEHLSRWMRVGPPPPSQPLIEVAGNPPELVRDEYGIARGGIRLPDVEVPLAAHTGHNGLNGMMILNGASAPFSPEVLHRLYHDKHDYVARYDQAIKRALDAGVILPVSAKQLRSQAEQTALL